MVELSPVDKDFDKLFVEKYNQLVRDFEYLLIKDIRNGLLDSSLNTKEFTKFIIHSTWGVLSLSPTLSTPENFLKNSYYILEHLHSYYN